MDDHERGEFSNERREHGCNAMAALVLLVLGTLFAVTVWGIWWLSRLFWGG